MVKYKIDIFMDTTDEESIKQMIADIKERYSDKLNIEEIRIHKEVGRADIPDGYVKVGYPSQKDLEEEVKYHSVLVEEDK